MERQAVPFKLLISFQIRRVNGLINSMELEYLTSMLGMKPILLSTHELRLAKIVLNICTSLMEQRTTRLFSSMAVYGPHEIAWKRLPMVDMQFGLEISPIMG